MMKLITKKIISTPIFSARSVSTYSFRGCQMNRSKREHAKVMVKHTKLISFLLTRVMAQ